jgi:hypothetical protein
MNLAYLQNKELSQTFGMSILHNWSGMKKLIILLIFFISVKAVNAQIIITDPVNLTLCQGLDATFNVSAVGNAPFHFQWQQNSGAGFVNISDGTAYTGTATASLIVRQIQPAMSSYQFRCSITDNLGLTANSNFATLTVNPLPIQPGAFSTSTATVCQGQTSVVYTVPNDASVTYTWSYSGTGATIFGTTNSISINYSLAATSGTLSVTATNGCGTSAARTLAITVNPTPIQPGAFSTSTATVCQGQTSVVYTVPNDASVTYTWSYSGTGATISGTTNSISISYNAAATSGTLSVTATNSCGTSAARTLAITVNLLPAQPGAYTTNTATVCQGQSGIVYTIPNDPLVTYTWSYSGTGATITGTTNSISISYSAAATSGTLSVTATNSCGTSAARTLDITVNPTPVQPGAFTTSAATVCQGQSGAVYTIPNDPSVTYTWSYSGTGATISGTTNSISINYSAAATSGTLSVTATNSCGTSAARTLAITVNLLPAQPGAYTTNTATVCQGQSGIVYTIPNDPLVTYTWSYSGTGATITGTTNSISINYSAAATSGTLSVTATNSCGTSAARTLAITVNPLPSQPGAFTTSAATVCQGQSGVVYTIPNDPSVTYTWSYSGTGATISGTTNSISISYNAAATSGTLSVTATNGCGTSAPRTLAITVTPLPIQPGAFTSSTASVCREQSGVIYTVPTDPSLTYNWNYSGSGVTITVTANSVAINFGSAATSGTLSVTTSNGCGTSAARTIAINVKPLPAQPGNFTVGTTPLCSGQSNIAYTVPNDTGVTYNWSYTGINTTIHGSGNSITLNFATNATSGTLSVSETNSCATGIPRTFPITVNPLPTGVSFTQSSPYSSTDTVVRFSHTPLGGVFSGIGITPSDSAFHPKLVGPGRYAIKYTYTSKGCSASFVDTVSVVNASGNIIGFSSNGIVCYSSAVIPIKGTPGITAHSGVINDWFEIDGVKNGKGITAIGDSTANFNPKIAGSGSHVVKYKFQKGVTIFEIAKTIFVDSIAKPDFIGLNVRYCDGEPQDTLIGINPSGGTGHFYFNGPAAGFITPINSNANRAAIYPHGVVQAIPGFTGSSFLVSYYYTSTLGCRSDTLSRSVSIYALPIVNFNIRSSFNVAEPPVKLVGNPSGGIFSGKGVIPSDTTFSPALATVQNHIPITYIYTDPHGCANSIIKYVDVITANAYIKGLTSNNIFCYDGKIDTLVGVSINGIPGGKITGSGITKFGKSDTALFHPNLAGNGVHTITYSYTNSSGTPFSVSATVTVDSIGPVAMDGLLSEYCGNDNRQIQLKILSTPAGQNGSVVYTGSGVSKNATSLFYFTPSSDTLPTGNVVLIYTRNFSGCKSISQKTIRINKAPVVDFALNNLCVINRNDSISFINKTKSADPVNAWSWNFGDAQVPAKDNVSSLFQPKHAYFSEGLKFISLIATTNKGCSNVKDSSVFLGNSSKASFVWKSECYYNDSSTMFIAAQYPVHQTRYIWNFGDNTSLKTDSVNTAAHHYSSLKSYNVSLVISNNFGCKDTLQQVINLRPVFAITDSSYYLENFAKGKNGWINETANSTDVSSWVFGKSAKFAGSGDSIWYTVPKFKKEQSVVSSPCFDFSSLKKPMIKFDRWSSFDKNRDGVVLQYLTNANDGWKNVGTLNDGINWYESFAISGQPGNQQIGWSGADNTFISARHQLNALIRLKEVRFRFIYASDGTNRTDNGFAFDNVWIGERQRIILLEHFTNSTDAKSLRIEHVVDSIAALEPLDMVNVKYHTNLYGSDNFDQLIHSSANVRVVYYGVPSVPYSEMDGGFANTAQYNYINHTLSFNDIEMRSLYDPDFKISLQTSNSSNIININTKISSLAALNNREITLHLAVLKVDTTITNTKYKNVLLTLLPDPAGVTYQQNWLPGDVKTYSEVYNVNNIRDTGKIIIVAFVQDEGTKEVLQVAVNKQPAILFTGIKPVTQSNPDNSHFTVYPNPAQKDIYLVFDGQSEGGIIEIYNQMGVLKQTIKREIDNNRYHVDISGYSSGFYLVRFIGENRQTFVKKLIVNH